MVQSNLGILPYGLQSLLNPVRRKIFISYHHESDQVYYNMFAKVFAEGYEAAQDNSLDRLIDSDNSEYVMRRIREYHITGTSCTIVLCGPQTRWRKYVDWEIKATLDKQHGLIGVHLPNNMPDIRGGVHKPDRLQDNLETGYALWIKWSDLLTGPDFLKMCIEQANSRSAYFINNNRALRQRNG